ncbi:MAG: hypothetical protein ACXWJK_08355 [Burkholderiaceae bacterium]
MEKPKQPDKQVIKDWIIRPRDYSKAYPSLQEIRRTLGWPLVTTVPNRRGA